MYAHEMSTVIVFLMTFSELLAAAIGYLKPYPELFDAVVGYGSPPYFIIHSLGNSSVGFEQNHLLPLIAAFHVIKYLALARSQFGVEWASLRYLAVAFEVVYLAVCFLNL